ncbi:hypothetical protein [Streptomyces phytophilus]|uniref:hypothetical protein n=1 Tax=Streptomyces phytophilus TaxID=722715 RepID=UPI0015F04847|nr:hypothetical protein [Streptomyces phytophilus]
MIRGRTNADGEVEFYDDATGTTVLTVAAGSAGLLASTPPVVNNTAASDVAGLVTAFNALLAALRTRGVITGT